MAALNQTVVAGGVVYPAGTAETDELRAKITNPALWDDHDGAEPDVVQNTITVKLEDSEEFREYVAKVTALVGELEARNEELEGQVADLTEQLEAAKASADPKTGDADSDESQDAPKDPYADLDVDALKAEIDKRNEGRDDSDKLSKRGGRDTLAAALVADDTK